MSRITTDDSAEVLDDVLSLFAKVLHDNEVNKRILIADLIEIRDTINKIRGHIATAGYKSMPKLQRSDP